MRRIDKLPRGVERCAALPQMTEDRDGFVDTGSVLMGVDQRVFLSATSIREAGRLFGWPSETDYDEVVARGAELEVRAEVAEAEVAELRARFDAIDVLEAADFRARKKAGRPKKEQSA